MSVSPKYTWRVVLINIVIAGGGGFGWEIAEYIRQDIASGKLLDVSVRGVIDDNLEGMSPISFPYLGSIGSYQPLDNDVVLLALGTPRGRRIVASILNGRGARFYSYIHSSVYLASNVSIGEGVIVCPNSIINSGACLSDFSVINVFGSVGHGASVGGFSVLSPYAALNGDAIVGSDCFLGTRSTVFPRVKVGNNCTIDSHSYVKASVGDKKIITNRGSYLVLNNRF